MGYLHTKMMSSLISHYDMVEVYHSILVSLLEKAVGITKPY